MTLFDYPCSWTFRRYEAFLEEDIYLPDLPIRYKEREEYKPINWDLLTPKKFIVPKKPQAISKLARHIGIDTKPIARQKKVEGFRL